MQAVMVGASALHRGCLHGRHACFNKQAFFARRPRNALQPPGRDTPPVARSAGQSEANIDNEIVQYTYKTMCEAPSARQGLSGLSAKDANHVLHHLVEYVASLSDPSKPVDPCWPSLSPSPPQSAGASQQDQWDIAGDRSVVHSPESLSPETVVASPSAGSATEVAVRSTKSDLAKLSPGSVPAAGASTALLCEQSPGAEGPADGTPQQAARQQGPEAVSLPSLSELLEQLRSEQRVAMGLLRKVVEEMRDLDLHDQLQDCLYRNADLTKKLLDRERELGEAKHQLGLLQGELVATRRWAEDAAQRAASLEGQLAAERQAVGAGPSAAIDAAAAAAAVAAVLLRAQANGVRQAATAEDLGALAAPAGPGVRSSSKPEKAEAKTEEEKRREQELLQQLCTAMTAKDVPLIEKLLRKGARTDLAINEDGDYPLHRVVGMPCYEACVALVQSGANVNARNKAGWTVLMRSSMRGSPNIARCLLEAGAKVNAVDPEGNTALHFAAARDSHSIVKVLLDFGANKSAKNKAGKTASSLAKGIRTKALLE